MKTFVAVALAVMGTALVSSRSTGQAAAYSSPPGRYTIVHLDGARALMLDTSSGAVWENVQGDYCWSKTPPGNFRQISYPERCKPDEESVSNILSFERVSVEGLYKTPIKSLIDANFSKQATQGTKPKQ